jgi:hypothetical protein
VFIGNLPAPEGKIVVASGKIGVFICRIFGAAGKDISFHVALDGKDWVSQVAFHATNHGSLKSRIFEKEATFGILGKYMAVIEIYPRWICPMGCKESWRYPEMSPQDSDPVEGDVFEQPQPSQGLWFEEMTVQLLCALKWRHVRRLLFLELENTGSSPVCLLTMMVAELPDESWKVLRKR